MFEDSAEAFYYTKAIALFVETLDSETWDRHMSPVTFVYPALLNTESLQN